MEIAVDRLVDLVAGDLIRSMTITRGERISDRWKQVPIVHEAHHIDERLRSNELKHFNGSKNTK